MGITFGAIERMENLGLFGTGRVAILDIGSSNLYSAEPEGIERFLGKYALRPVPDAKAFAQRLAKGSDYDPVRGGLNESFAGELFEKAGMEYLAFDIADGYRTRILDLNHAELPPDLQNRFDLVLNFGTTEHILNQYNSFKVIHDATKLGGYIHHSLPGIGYVDHGYITYTCRCFFDIAGYNEYEVVDFWFDGPSGHNDILAGLRSYSAYFPALKRALDELLQSPQGTALNAATVPDVGLNIVYRKVKDKPFWGALESSTSVGAIPESVTASYAESSSGVAAQPNAARREEPAPAPEPIVRKISRSLSSYPALHRIVRRVYRTLRSQSPAFASAGARPALTPSGEADKLRDRFHAGRANYAECMRFYSLVVAAEGKFPYDWEERILRLGIAEHPERKDLAERLEIVLGLLGEQPVAAESSAGLSEEGLHLRRKIASFGARALVGLTDPAAVEKEFGDAEREAIGILNSPAFARLPAAAQVAAIVAIHDTTMSAVLRESIAIADLMASHFARLLREKTLTLAQAMRLYDCLYALYFAGAQSVSEMSRFDSACVQPFDAYLRSMHSGAGTPRAKMPVGEAKSICYFCHCAHFDKGNAVSPIMASLARSHAAQPGRKVYLYCVQWVSQEFVDAFAGSGVVVRQFQQDWRYDKLDAIAAQLAADEVDVAVTDLNSSIASYVFSQRAAPLQMWIVMAFPYWSLQALDWTMLPVLDYRPDFGIAADRYNPLGIKQEPITLIRDCSEAALRAARSTLPEGAFVFAVFSRLIKVPAVFLHAVRRALIEEPRAHLLIVGTGDPRAVYEFAGDAALKGRVTFIHGNVDLNVYGRVIDAMLDTFPFHAGNACREIAIHGKPVLSMNDPEWRQLLQDERDPALLARDVDEFVGLALRLARDRDFYAARSAESRRVAERVTQTADMVAEVEQAIEKARAAPARAPALDEGPRTSQLDRLIMRNVAGKNGGPAFYPGQPDPMAQQFPQSAKDFHGQESGTVITNAESLLLGYILNLYRRSDNAAARGLNVDPEVRRKLMAIYEANQTLASPLFLATRYLIGEMYARVRIEEPALELGMGSGDTAKAILGDRKLAVGSTPIIDEIMGARHHYGNHRCYLAVDAAQIPYADETFNSIVMNYTFYHLEDPARTCREMLRVLAPGGRLYFNFAIRDRIEATRVWPRLMDELGLKDYARMSSGFVFTDYGGGDSTPTRSGCLALLERSGFADIEAIDYLSPDLSRLIWLTRDLEILFQLNLHQAIGKPALETAYREFVEREIAALLSHDAALCAEKGGTFMFVSACKAGSGGRAYSDDEVRSRLVCPVSRAPLETRAGFMWSGKAKTAYPVYKDIALLMPIYAEIWRRQNAAAENDPAEWIPFSY